MGTPVFLCSSDSDFMTGQAIVVDPGGIDTAVSLLSVGKDR